MFHLFALSFIPFPDRESVAVELLLASILFTGILIGCITLLRYLWKRTPRYLTKDMNRAVVIFFGNIICICAVLLLILYIYPKFSLFINYDARKKSYNEEVQSVTEKWHETNRLNSLSQ